MKPGDIYLAQFPFGDAPEAKLRPVLVLTPLIGPRAEILIAYISSVVPRDVLSSDILLNPFLPENKMTKLKVVSVVRLHKLATIHATSLARRLGAAPPSLWPEVSKRLRTLLNL